MADQSDVETALVVLLAAALYPHGPEANSVTGGLCRVYRGWPSSAALDEDLAADAVNVSVFALPGHQRTTTRFPDSWSDQQRLPTLRVTVIGDSLVLAGRGDAGQVVGVLVDGVALRYVTVAGDTPRSVALALMAQLGSGRPALLLNETIRVPGVGCLVARVVCPAHASREVRRQCEAYRISFWCPDPLVRDRVVAFADLSLAGRSFIDLPDGSSGRLRYVRTETIDKASDAALFRRDLIYEVEFATMQHEWQAAMLFADMHINHGPDRLG